MLHTENTRSGLKPSNQYLDSKNIIWHKNKIGNNEILSLRELQGMERFSSYNHPFPHGTLLLFLYIHQYIIIYICSFSLTVASLAGQPDLDIPLSFFTQFAWLPREKSLFSCHMAQAVFFTFLHSFQSLEGFLFVGQDPTSACVLLVAGSILRCCTWAVSGEYQEGNFSSCEWFANGATSTITS